MGGGARHSEFDSNSNRIADIVYRGTTATLDAGIVRIHYSIIPSTGNPVGDNVDVRWWHDKDSHSPESVCTLVGTSDGSISGLLAAGIVIVRDKVYHVDWDAGGDGLARFQRFTLNGQVNLSANIVGAISNPSGLPGLTSWFEANDATTIISGATSNVSEWRDKAGGISGVAQFVGANQPTLSVAANNMIDGVFFDKSNSEFLFTNEAPITGEPSTIFLIYEPTTLDIMTVFSLSNDGVSPFAGLTDYEYWSMTTRSSDSTLRLSDQDFGRQASGIAPRLLSLPSGAIVDNTRLAVWRNAPFDGKGQLLPSGQPQETEFTTDGTVEATGLGNTTFGRFSGAQISGVYDSVRQYFDGTIYEIVVYNRILADVEVERFKLYAEDKYNLSD